ncbi:hypothetical protein FGB62_181g02 [Gracilaria domingensis]|nr:hypothetical protein FGB62_181g02 [Gracilaria domingensis]
MRCCVEAEWLARQSGVVHVGIGRSDRLREQEQRAVGRGIQKRSTVEWCKLALGGATDCGNRSSGLWAGVCKQDRRKLGDGACNAVPERSGWHGRVEWCTLTPLVIPTWYTSGRRHRAL